MPLHIGMPSGDDAIVDRKGCEFNWHAAMALTSPINGVGGRRLALFLSG